MKKKCISTLLFLHSNNSEKPKLLLPAQQKVPKLRFLQKLACQKPCWDQARLSSLVNKQECLGQQVQHYSSVKGDTG